MLFFYALLLSFYIQGGRVIRKVRVSDFNDTDYDSISTCLIYIIYLLIDLSHLGSHAWGFESLLLGVPSHSKLPFLVIRVLTARYPGYQPLLPEHHRRYFVTKTAIYDDKKA
jgi:hypothetical protein